MSSACRNSRRRRRSSPKARSAMPATARSGMARKAGTASPILARAGDRVETQRGLPGDPEDRHSRYIEAAVEGLIVGCLYLPNGNPAPGPKFDYKLRWFERLTAHAADLLGSRHAGGRWPATTTSCRPSSTSTSPSAGWTTRCFGPRSRTAFHAAGRRRAGPMRCAPCTRSERIYTFWDYFRNAYGRDAGLRIDHLLLSPSLAERLAAAGVDREVRGWEKASDHAPTWIELRAE